MGEMFPGTLGILVFALRSDQGLGFLLIPRGPEEPGEGRCLKSLGESLIRNITQRLYPGGFTVYSCTLCCVSSAV